MVIALVAPAFFLTGCTITGRSSDVLSEDIVACPLSTRIGFLTINDVVQACYRDSSLYFVVENAGSSQLSGFSVMLEADYNVTMLVKQKVLPGETVQESLNFGSDMLAGIKSLTVYPFVGDEGGMRECAAARITALIEKC